MKNFVQASRSGQDGAPTADAPAGAADFKKQRLNPAVNEPCLLKPGQATVVPLKIGKPHPRPPIKAGRSVLETLKNAVDSDMFSGSQKELEKLASTGRYTSERIIKLATPNQPGGLLRLPESCRPDEHHHAIILCVPDNHDTSLGVLRVQLLGRCAVGAGDRQDPVEIGSVLAQLAGSLAGCVFDESAVGLQFASARKLFTFVNLSTRLPDAGQPRDKVNATTGTITALITGILETLASAAPRQMVALEAWNVRESCSQYQQVLAGGTQLLCCDADFGRYLEKTAPFLHGITMRELEQRGLRLRPTAFVLPFSDQARLGKPGSVASRALDGSAAWHVPLARAGNTREVVTNLDHLGWLANKTRNDKGELTADHLDRAASCVTTGLGQALGLGQTLSGCGKTQSIALILRHLLSAQLVPCLAKKPSAAANAIHLSAQLVTLAHKGDTDGMLRLAISDILGFGAYDPVYAGKGGHARAQLLRALEALLDQLENNELALTVWSPVDMTKMPGDAYIDRSLPATAQLVIGPPTKELRQRLQKTHVLLLPDDLDSRGIADALSILTSPDAASCVLLLSAQTEAGLTPQQRKLLFNSERAAASSDLSAAGGDFGKRLLDDASRHQRQHVEPGDMYVDADGVKHDSGGYSAKGEAGDGTKKGAGRASGGDESYKHAGRGNASTLAAPVVFSCGGVGAVQVTAKLLSGNSSATHSSSLCPRKTNCCKKNNAKVTKRSSLSLQQQQSFDTNLAEKNGWVLDPRFG